MEHRDAIVVGGGPGGLACAALLAKGGKRVVVLEGRRRIGGRATSFAVKDVLTELAWHGLPAGSKIERLLPALGQPVPLVKLEPNFVIYHDKRFFEVPGRVEEFAKFDYIPQADRAELVEILRLIARMSFEEAEDYDWTPWGDWIREHTSSQALYDFLALLATIFLTDEFMSDLAAGEMIRVFSIMLKEGVWDFYPKEGAFNAINEAFARAIKAMGGEVRTESRVREVTVKDNTAMGVTVEVPEGVLKLEAPIVILGFPVWEIFRIVSPDCFPSWFVDRVHFLEQKSRMSAIGGMGISFVSSEPLHSYKTALLVPCTSPDNASGPSYIKWLSEPTNWAPKLSTKGTHLIQYGPVLPRYYVDLLREKPSTYEKEANGLWKETWKMFPNFNPKNILWKGGAVMPLGDFTMKFPGNTWKQRLDVKAPCVDGLYLVGDTVRGWGLGSDCAVSSAILCAERILKTKVV